MAHLIDKSKLLEGLKELKQNLSASPIVVIKDVESLVESFEEKEIGVDFGDPKGDKSAKCIIDTKTLDVKDVDLEKEIDDYWNKLCDSEFGELLERDTKWFDDIAKHFYELGLKAQK